MTWASRYQVLTSGTGAAGCAVSGIFVTNIELHQPVGPRTAGRTRVMSLISSSPLRQRALGRAAASRPPGPAGPGPLAARPGAAPRGRQGALPTALRCCGAGPLPSGRRGPGGGRSPGQGPGARLPPPGPASCNQ